MGGFGLVFTLAVVVYGVLFLTGALTLLAPKLHPWLERVVTATWIVTVLHTLVVIAVLIGGTRPTSMLTIAGYLLVSVAMLPLLGIGRLGEPGALPQTAPDQPTLSRRQIAKVDGVAAMVLAVTFAVVIFRIASMLDAAVR